MADLKPLTGRFELLHPTEYLKAADLGERDVTIVIEGIYEEVLTMQGNKKERKPVLKLQNRAGRVLGKRLVLNKTNAKLIAAAVGEKSVERWAGKAITLYATTTRGARGETMDCVRVRAKVNNRADEIPEAMAADPEPRRAFTDELGGDAEGSEEGAREPGSDA